MIKYLVTIMVAVCISVSGLYAQQADSARLQRSERQAERIQKKRDRTQNKIDKKEKKLDRQQRKLDRKARKTDKESRKMERRERETGIIRRNSTKTTSFLPQRLPLVTPNTSGR